MQIMFTELFFISILHNVICSKNIFNIAEIFEDSQLEQVLRYAIGEINSEENTTFNLRLFESNNQNRDDPYFAMESTCVLLNHGIFAVFGPTSLSNVNVVKSICAAKKIPQILTHWTGPLDSDFQINFYPEKKLLSQAYVDIIGGLGWTEFTLLYTNSESLLRLGVFIENAKLNGHIINIEKLDHNHKGRYSSVLRKLRKNNQRFFMLDCEVEHLHGILIQFQQHGLLTSSYNYFLTNLDIHSENLEMFSHSEADIIGIRLVSPTNKLVQHVTKKPEIFRRSNNISRWILSSEVALIIDSVHMFADSLRYLNISQSPILDCSNIQEYWEDGYSIVNKLKSSSYTGLSGPIKFGSNGYRSEFELNVYKIGESLNVLGSWNNSHGFNISKELYNDENDDMGDDPLRNKHLVIITTLVEPYAMQKRLFWDGSDVNNLEGFVVDLIHELSLLKGFRYSFTIRDDGKYGQYNKSTSQWTGMIGDLISGKADLAISDLTITYEREQIVEFTPPFMVFGISILYQKPTRVLPSFFSFAYPIANIWTHILISGIGVSFVLFILGRISPSDWQHKYISKEKPEYMVNHLTFGNCVWFVIGSLMMQHSKIKLKSVATRTVAGLWWFCTFLIVSFYTAKLVTILSTQKPVVPFSNLKELIQMAEEDGIQYGAKFGGSTANFFRDRARHYPNSDFAKAWKYMSERDEVMVPSNQNGVEKVATENYALFMESSSLQYETQRRCGLTQIGGLLDEKGYGIAMRKNEPFRNSLNGAILELQNSGKIDQIKRKWWKDHRGHLSCYEDTIQPLDIKYFAGVFWLTCAGILVAVLVATWKVIARKYNTITT